MGAAPCYCCYIVNTRFFEDCKCQLPKLAALLGSREQPLNQYKILRSLLSVYLSVTDQHKYSWELHHATWEKSKVNKQWTMSSRQNGWMKLDIDTAIFASSGRIGVGAAIRDRN